MKEAGVVAISDDGRPVMNARVMRRAMEFARSFDLPVIDHCEDLQPERRRRHARGRRSPCGWACAAFPRASEDVMVARDILLAELTGARYHVAHISIAPRRRHGGVRQGAAACRSPAKPRRITSRSADRDMPPYDSNYKMKPPLRSACDARRGGRGHRRRRHRRHRHRSRAAPRQREDAGVRDVPVRHHRPGNRARRWRSKSWCTPARSRWPAWWSCSPPARNR